MRLVVWNCAGGFARKLAPLLRLAPDVAIVPECARAAFDDPRWRADQLCWRGPEPGRGLAIIVFGGWTVEPVGIEVADRWFLPAIVRGAGLELRVCAVWAKPAENYLGPTLRALEACATFLTEGAAIVAGDFNHNVSLDKARGRRRFRDVVEHLGRLGLLSAWHRHRAEAHGSESSPTLYFPAVAGARLSHRLRVHAAAAGMAAAIGDARHLSGLGGERSQRSRAPDRRGRAGRLVDPAPAGQ